MFNYYLNAVDVYVKDNATCHRSGSTHTAPQSWRIHARIQKSQD
jgi:hypothetical protein